MLTLIVTPPIFDKTSVTKPLEAYILQGKSDTCNIVKLFVPLLQCCFCSDRMGKKKEKKNSWRDFFPLATEVKNLPINNVLYIWKKKNIYIYICRIPFGSLSQPCAGLFSGMMKFLISNTVLTTATTDLKMQHKHNKTRLGSVTPESMQLICCLAIFIHFTE